MPKPKPIPTIEYKDFSLKIHSRYGQLDRVIKAQMELTYRCNLTVYIATPTPITHGSFSPAK